MILIISEDFKSFEGVVQKILVDQEIFHIKIWYLSESIGFSLHSAKHPSMFLFIK